MSSAVAWRADYEAALGEAKESGRPLVVEFYLEGCPHCRRLAAETHTDARVAAALNDRFVPVRLEGRHHMDLVQKFGVRGAPTTLIVDSTGKEMARLVGFHTPEEYLAELNKVA